MSDNETLGQAELNGMTLIQVHLLLNDMMDCLLDSDIVGCGRIIQRASSCIDDRIKKFREYNSQ